MIRNIRMPERFANKDLLISLFKRQLELGNTDYNVIGYDDIESDDEGGWTENQEYEVLESESESQSKKAAEI